MIKIIEGSNETAELREAYRFRHRIFVDEAGWAALRKPDGLERDGFDDDHAVHMLLYAGGRLIGYQRMLPTTRPYLLTSIYPQLCDRPAPSSETVFEWTRFAVDPKFRGDRGALGAAGARLVLAFVNWGLARGVDSVVVEFEPGNLLKFWQCHFMPFPLGLIHKIDGRDTIAVRAHFDHRTRSRLIELAGEAELQRA